MSQPRAVLPAMVVMLALCLAAGMGVAALNWYATSPFTADMPVQVCAGLTTAPRVRIGLSWYAPIMSFLPPLAFSPWALCVQVPEPWIRPLVGSLAGEWMFPP
jgi:hypothetical protein